MNKGLLTFTAILAILTALIGVVTTQVASPSFLTLILSSLAVATWLVFFFMQRTNQENFIKNYLLTIVLKLIAGGIFIFVLIYADEPSAEANALLFMVAYFLLTSLEVGFLFSRMK